MAKVRAVLLSALNFLLYWADLTAMEIAEYENLKKENLQLHQDVAEWRELAERRCDDQVTSVFGSFS